MSENLIGGWLPTADRDIRFSARQIAVTVQALRDEVRRRTRSIDRAEASARAGNTIQRNVLQDHYESRDVARRVITNLEVAARQIHRANTVHYSDHGAAAARRRDRGE